jgi:hypothetical protein
MSATGKILAEQLILKMAKAHHNGSPEGLAVAWGELSRSQRHSRISAMRTALAVLDASETHRAVPFEMTDEMLEHAIWWVSWQDKWENILASAPRVSDA